MTTGVYTLSAYEALTLWTELSAGIESGARVRITVDDGVKIDTGTGWSAPMGTVTIGRSR